MSKLWSIIPSSPSRARGWLGVGCGAMLLLSGCSFFRAQPSDTGSSPEVTIDTAQTANDPRSIGGDPTSSSPTSSKPTLTSTPSPSSTATPPTDSIATRPTPASSTPASPTPTPGTKKQPLTETEVNAAAKGLETETQTSQKQGVAVDDQQVIKLAKETEKKVPIARQNVGETILSDVLINLQAEHLLQQKFVSTLAALPAKIPAETTEYRFRISEATANEAIALAEAKTEGLPSYVGVTHVVQTGKLPISGICKSNLPSSKAPDKPRIVEGTIVCARGSTALDLN